MVSEHFKKLDASFPPAFKALVDHFAEIGKLEERLELYKVEKRTGRVDRKAAAEWNKSITILARSIETYYRTKPLATLFDGAYREVEADMLSDQQVKTLNAMFDEYKARTALPSALGVALSDIEAEGRIVHAEAKAANDWDMIAPWLEDVLEKEREAGKAIQSALNLDHPIDGMVHMRSPGFSRDEVNDYIYPLVDALQPLIQQAIYAQSERDGSGTPREYNGPYNVSGQVALNEKMAAMIGMDMERGALRYSDNDPIEGGTMDYAVANLKLPSKEGPFYRSLKTAIHEAGHEIYIQGLPAAYRYNPVGQDLGGVMHESIALLYDMVIGRTPAFCELIAKEASQVFGEKIDGQELFEARTRITHTPDRKTADEMTYHLHVAARWRGYQDLFEGRVSVVDYPNHLAGLYKDIVGVEIFDPVALALSDVHLFVGKGALYPSYTLGHGIACQLWQTMESDMPMLRGNLRSGEFAHISNWLSHAVFSKGRMDSLHDVVMHATHEPLNRDYQIRHLSQRYIDRPPPPGLVNAAPDNGTPPGSPRPK